LERIPIASQTTKLCEVMHSDPVVAALNGGEDYELMFTVPLAMQDKITAIGGIDVIGHITPLEAGVKLVTPDGSEIAVTAPGWVSLA
jgi:thiamine-monophosphate kinase